jgi:hypothetical protein
MFKRCLEFNLVDIKIFSHFMFISKQLSFLLKIFEIPSQKKLQEAQIFYIIYF